MSDEVKLAEQKYAQWEQEQYEIEQGRVPESIIGAPR